MSKIIIVDYQPVWIEQFAELASQIRSAVGTNAIRIDHIGSTSVLGLAAKDILDIQITVADLHDPGWIRMLQVAGFRMREQVVNDLLTGMEDGSDALEKKFFREIPGQRRAHIHVREQGRLNQVYPLLFRDYLKADGVVRMAYETVKRALAEHFPNNPDVYYQIKDPYMDTIYQGARYWAAQGDWKPDNQFR